MSSLNLVYRPIDMNEVVGNEDLKSSLSSILSRDMDKIPHAFLFTGKAGCGKTTFARLVATALGAYNPNAVSTPDFREFNASNTRGIDTIRDINTDCIYSPVSAECIVYLMDEVHALTKDAQNAFLKLLEEPPYHVYFILSTTDPQLLIEPIRSRCVKFDVKPCRRDDIYTLLKEVIGAEFEDDADKFPESVIQKITEVCEGVPRDALILLEKVIDIQDEKQALTILDTAFVADASIRDLCQLFINGSLSSEDRWKQVSKVLEGLKDARGQNDPEKMRRGILDYMTKVLITSPDHMRVAKIAKLFSENFYSCGESGIRIASYFSCFMK